MHSHRGDLLSSGHEEDATTLARWLERRNRELGILNEISQALNGAGDVHSALDATLTLVAELLGLRSAWVWLLDSEGRPYLAASRHLPPFLQEPARMEGWLCRCLDQFLGGEMEGAENIDVLECSRLEGAKSGSEGLRYHASIPLYLREKRVGVMNVAGSDWRGLSAEELRLLNTVGNHVAVAVERSRLAEEGVRAARLEERNRLAREIHDTLAQQLAGIALQLDTADALLPDSPREARERVRAGMALTREALQEARRSVQHLRATALEGRTLPEALGYLTARFTHETGIQARVEADSSLPALAVDAETELYRVCQEALTNVRRHATSARTVLVTLRVDADTLRLCVLDDGSGLAPNYRRRRGYGLVGMRERARLLGGELRVESLEGKGTRLTVALPLPPGTETGE
ncbi:MAG: GAF domain-containing sensor histidine kinase [Chloroflexota bacterium]|nr:GAF domain-containing sensor histidine kinase [Chloroflexota bacterium]